MTPETLSTHFLTAPLLQNRYREGFGTLFTAEYDPKRCSLRLTLNGATWDHTLATFEEGQRCVNYTQGSIMANGAVPDQGVDWSAAAMIDWATLARDYASGQGREISAYLPTACERGAAAA